MKRLLAVILLVCLLAGCGTVAEEVPLVPIDPNPSVGEETGVVSGGENTTPLPVHVHEFSDATCTEAKTCACGETEGDAMGHAWDDATCNEPKTCSVCGMTEGEAKGHSWLDATCAEPKICEDCGKTEGNAAEHVYQAGKCTVCGALDPEPPTGEMVWIPKSGKKYHATSSCSNMKNPTEVTKEEAIQRNFTPCKKCYG